MPKFILAAVMAAAVQLHPQAPGTAQAQAPKLEVRVTDLSPRFLRFHELAIAEGADAERRWQLWKEHYDFAAVPPVPERDSLARELLDAAWPRYSAVMGRVRAGAAGIEPAPEPILRGVADLLELDSSLTIELLLFVGGLEKNAFFMVNQGVPTVAIPIEADPEWRATTMAHEYTHAVHNRLAGLSGGWERSIAQTIVNEGLANRVKEALFPGLPAAAYVEHEPGWFDLAASREREILTGILPHLAADDSESVMRFTMGSGTTGIAREAYYTGWLVIGQLLESGYDYPRLARIPAEKMPALVRRAIEELLRGSER